MKGLSPRYAGGIVKEAMDYYLTSSSGNKMHRVGYIEGVKTRIERLYRETGSEWMSAYYESFMRDSICTTCHGARLSPETLSVKVNGLNIYEACCLSLDKLLAWVDETSQHLNDTEHQIGDMVLKEIHNRVSFLVNVGLDYLTLSRYAMTLSGGEAQRIRLATQIGSRLSGVLYVLDEPSIGLHQRDNDKLISTLKEMRDLGNTLIVVEHDEETMRQADYLVDIGPGAGIHGTDARSDLQYGFEWKMVDHLVDRLHRLRRLACRFLPRPRLHSREEKTHQRREPTRYGSSHRDCRS